MTLDSVPIWEKPVLSIEETMQYTGIGEHSIRDALKKPGCPFVFYVGRKAMVKRKELEQYIAKHSQF